MTIKFQENEVELVYSFRSAIYFEQIQKKNLDFSNFTGNDLITLFYCVFISSLQKNKMPIVDMLEFLDVVDDNGGDRCILDFSNWYIDIIKKQYEVIDSMDDENDKKKIVKSSKKKN